MLDALRHILVKRVGHQVLQRFAQLADVGHRVPRLKRVRVKFTGADGCVGWDGGPEIIPRQIAVVQCTWRYCGDFQCLNNEWRFQSFAFHNSVQAEIHFCE